MLFFILVTLLKILVLIVCVLISVAFFTIIERKLMALIQRRRGPNVVGWFGLLQAFCDALKLIIKETIIPNNSNFIIFIFSPIFTLIISLAGWVVIPFQLGAVIANINLGILYFFAVSSLGVYSIIMAGWSSNSKYSFLGALRSAAQMISYEVAIGFTIISVFLCAGSLNLTEVVMAQQKIWYMFPLFPMFIVFFISALAETNRHPFDLPEAEAELVSGYNTEYSAIGFTLFFLSEYASILLMCTMIVLLFLGGWLPPLEFLDFIPSSVWMGSKIIIFVLLFVIIRSVFPRFRFDQLMHLGWKIFIPLTLGWTILVSGVLYGFSWVINPSYFSFF